MAANERTLLEIKAGDGQSHNVSVNHQQWPVMTRSGIGASAMGFSASILRVLRVDQEPRNGGAELAIRFEGPKMRGFEPLGSSWQYELDIKMFEMGDEGVIVRSDRLPVEDLYMQRFEITDLMGRNFDRSLEVPMLSGRIAIMLSREPEIIRQPEPQP